MKTREEAAAFVDAQLHGFSEAHKTKREKGNQHHYGKQELRDLFDFIWGRLPFCVAEEITGYTRKSCSAPPYEPKFKLGDHVRKTKGSRWSGKVVGFYSTELTPEGYAVESLTEWGSVQIYPAAALELIPTEE